jgi:4-hydroxythreonine-4-phosphate dehydrogenase
MPTFLSGRKRPIVCITIGNPRGIGLEVIRKALKNPALKNKADFLIIGDPTLRKSGRRACARNSIESINKAFELVAAKKADALVTGPVSKEDINKIGLGFKGHTEYLAGLCGCEKFAMMFISDKLKLSLVSRHIALGKVSRFISANMIYDTVDLTYNALKKWFGVGKPKIGIAGLNPHCGEGGEFGNEESSVIRPAINRLKKRYNGIFGPIPGDTLLYDVYHKRFDAAVCMYHDQGLGAFKMISRNNGVNLTLGLPFIRTSPDHGTGFDIAGKDIADPGSMFEAIKLATNLVGRGNLGIKNAR